MTIIGLLIIAAVLGALEIPALFRQGDWRSLATVVVILLLGAGFGIAVTADVPVPTVAQVIRSMVGPLVETQ